MPRNPGQEYPGCSWVTSTTKDMTTATMPIALTHNDPKIAQFDPAITDPKIITEPHRTTPSKTSLRPTNPKSITKKHLKIHLYPKINLPKPNSLSSKFPLTNLGDKPSWSGSWILDPMDQEFANLCQNYDWHCIWDPGHGSYLAVLRRIGRKLKKISRRSYPDGGLSRRHCLLCQFS